MTFRLGEIAKGAKTLADVKLECPSGKVAYRTREEARQSASRVNQRQHTNMTPFRCSWCTRSTSATAAAPSSD